MGSEKVAVLEHENTLELPPTFRLAEGRSKFDIVGNQAFITEYYGPLHSFNLKSGREEVLFPFREHQVRALANDGANLFLRLEGDFELRQTDVLLAKVLSTFETEDYEGKKYRDGFCEFVGKPIEELPREHHKYRMAKENGITSRIVSCSLKQLARPMIVFAPENFTDQNPRFLIHQDMSSLWLFSGKGHVDLWYNEHSGEGGCETSCTLYKEGTAEERFNVIEEQMITNPVIEISYPERKTLCAMLYQERAAEENDEDMHTEIPIVFSGNVRINRRITEIQREGDRVHILYEPETTRTDFPDWTYGITSPAVLDTYRVSLREA
ncbi:MAG TPA: hypothetical protein VMC80_00690 [Patescibacteria group bacterium]|nr:hypothetical protein [Patescibacteria group bacterium]